MRIHTLIDNGMMVQCEIRIGGNNIAGNIYYLIGRSQHRRLKMRSEGRIRSLFVIILVFICVLFLGKGKAYADTVSSGSCSGSNHDGGDT